MAYATAPQAFAALQARVAAEWTLAAEPIYYCPVYWQDEPANEPIDETRPFIFVVVETYRQLLKEFGGGRGNTIWQNGWDMEAYAIVPKGTGKLASMQIAEAFASKFRAKSFDGLYGRESTIDPSALTPEGARELQGNYSVTLATTFIWFDQVG